MPLIVKQEKNMLERDNERTKSHKEYHKELYVREQKQNNEKEKDAIKIQRILELR